MSFQGKVGSAVRIIRQNSHQDEQVLSLRDCSLMISTATLGFLGIAAWIAMVFGGPF